MKPRSKNNAYMLRLAVIALISLAFSVVFNEVTYAMQREATDRAPQTIQLVIPAGTAEQVASGIAAPGIPEQMVFVVGDTLEVVNEDSVSHQLGPIWVPAGSTGSLRMDQVENVSYSCSFQTEKFLGLDIRSPTTWTTRLSALFLTAPTLAALLFLYSLAAFPIKQTKKQVAEEQV